MSAATVASFEDLKEEYYPGSKRQIGTVPPRTKVSVTDGLSAREYVVNGVKRKFYTIGQLAAALNRKSVTMRKWEREGILPKSQYHSPSDDARGRHRLYTEEQLEGIVRIAREERILDPYRPDIRSSNFTARVVALFKALS